MHGIVVLLATIFYIGMEKPPEALTDVFALDSYAQPEVERAVETQACYEEAVKLKTALEQNPKVRGWDIRCGYIPIKDKV